KRFLFSLIAVVFYLGMILFTYLLSFEVFSLLLFISGCYILLKYQFEIFPISKIIEQVYDNTFYNKKQLKDLPSKPTLIINSTNLQTGRQFVFTGDGMGDSTYTDDYKSKKE